MSYLKNALKSISVLFGLILITTSCVGAGQGNPLPTPVATASNENVTVDQPNARQTRIPADKYADLEIVTLLPRDAIPAIDNPRFLTAAEADDYYDPNELVMGVTFNGETRAYSVPFLSGHEIVNDTVGGVKIAVTW